MERFPIYSVWLPLYSFWSMDDFSWGNTRKVVGEGDKKTVVYENDEPFNDNMIPYKSFKGESTTLLYPFSPFGRVEHCGT